MKNRQLGNSGLQVSPICLGGNVFGWTADEKTSFQLLDAFVDRGCNFIDTADVYSAWAPGNRGGESEAIIGKWFKKSGKRDKVILATKIGAVTATHSACLSRNYILHGVEESLGRLETDRIDVYWAHRDDHTTPLEETLRTFGELISAGKVRTIGASNYTAERLRQALEVSRENRLPRYEAMQPHYNLMERKEYETTLEPIVRSEHLGVTPYFALARGFLAGKYRSEADLRKSPRGEGVKQYLNEHGLRVLAVLDGIAKSKKTTPACVAISWLLARPSVTSPIASATSLVQLEQILSAANVELDPAAIEKLNLVSAY